MRTEYFANLRGLYVLAQDGQLGVYDELNQFQPDAELTAALQKHTLRLLKSYSAGGAGETIRIGLVCPPGEGQPWKTETLFFEERVVRQIFPVGTTSAPLTVFQKKNQQHSIYRGIESLLGFRAQEEDAVAMFCPVLFDRGWTLDMYRPMLGREEKADDAQTPVIEVLNLLAGLPLHQRDTPVLRSIEARIRSTLIQRNKRRNTEFTLLDKVEFEKNISHGAVYEIDARVQREITLHAKDIDKLHVSQRHDGVERWLEVPHRPIHHGDLRRFFQFHELNDACLDVFAARSLVYTAPVGTPLLDRGTTDKWNMYLLEGTLLLDAADGQVLTIEGGTPGAQAPVAFLKPRKYKVSTLTKVSFLWIHDDLLRAVRAVQDAPRTSQPKQLKKSNTK